MPNNETPLLGGAMSSSPNGRGHPSRNHTQWCLTISVVTFLCAISLIGMSEGWLEALGLGRRVEHDKDCSSPLFTQETLKLLHEEAIQRLASDKGSFGEDLLAKFEASGIEPSRDKANYYVVFDNSYHIGKFNSELSFDKHVHPGKPSLPTNKIIPWPGKTAEDVSSFEGISYNATSGTYLIMQEALEYKDGVFANVLEVRIHEDTDEIEPVNSCRCDYQFTHSNKGFEGLSVLSHSNGKSYLLGLCEGNFCVGGSKGQKAGNGRLVVMERGADADGNCEYKMVTIIEIPKDANFEDYSDMDIFHNHMAIASQASAALWIGQFDLVDEKDGLVVLSPGRVWDFPRNDVCQVKYCNVEGIAWEDVDKVVAVSDQMKSKGKQHFRCWDKDQSLHAFAINDFSLTEAKPERKREL